MKSDESAFSIVPSRLSSRLSLSTVQTGHQDSITSSESLAYRRLSFEDGLFTSRVYKRNYRNPRFRWLRKQKVDPDRETATPPKEGPQNINLKGGLDPLLTSEALPTDTITKTATLDVDVIAQERMSRLEHRYSSFASDWYEKLVEACSRGENAKVKSLCSKMTDVPSLLLDRHCNSMHLCPIHATVSSGHVAVMQTLLQYSSYDVSQFLVNAMCCNREGCWPPIHMAAKSGNRLMVNLLLDKGASVNRRAWHGIQAIHLAAEDGSLFVLEALITAGADVNCTDSEGRQPLHYISDSRDLPEVIEYLVESGAIVDGHMGFKIPTPLHLACKNDFLNNVSALKSAGALLIQSSSRQCDSALDAAIRHSSPSSVEMLLEFVDPMCCRLDGDTALHTFVLAFYANASRPHDRSADERILRMLLPWINLSLWSKNGSVLYLMFDRVGKNQVAVTRELAKLFLDNFHIVEHDKLTRWPRRNFVNDEGLLRWMLRHYRRDVGERAGIEERGDTAESAESPEKKTVGTEETTKRTHIVKSEKTAKMEETVREEREDVQDETSANRGRLSISAPVMATNSLGWNW